MTYNRFLYNSALYNAGREEVGAVARSLIQAHTGPHIQAVAGTDEGLSFISDFTIVEGALTSPPAAYNFPDLKARINVVESDRDNLGALIRGFAFRDLPASIFLVDKIPDLPAEIFALLQKDLAAILVGVLAEKDLPALLTVNPYHNLPAFITGRVLDTRTLGARIFGPPPANLAARIHTPLDLPAFLASVQADDLPGSIVGFGFKDLGGNMLGIPAPTLNAFLRGFERAAADLPSAVGLRATDPDLPAAINAVLSGETGFRVGIEASIAPSGGYDDLMMAIVASISQQANLGALIKTGGNLDLPAIINLFGADNIQGTIGAIPFGEKNRQLLGLLQPVRPFDLAASIISNSNLKNLVASIQALHGSSDLNAFIRVAETFVTAIFTIVTLSSANLRATIGNPDCEGGSAIKHLLATATAQQARNLSANIQSFIESDLGAVINTGTTFYAFDTIDVFYSPTRVRNRKFRATDTIAVTYSPFRGRSLGASITATLPTVNLGASLIATFPPPRVAPSVSRLTAADIRAGEELNIQEIRFQLEGALLEYFYVNGTDDAFIRDFNEDWKINIRSFQPIAEGLFGDFAAARVCRLGSLISFATLDEAVRFCIAAVLGLEGQAEIGATINAAGSIAGLPATVLVSNTFQDLKALASRVFPSELLNATITSTGGHISMNGIIRGSSPGTSDMNAAIDPFSDTNLSAQITAV